MALQTYPGQAEMVRPLHSCSNQALNIGWVGRRSLQLRQTIKGTATEDPPANSNLSSESTSSYLKQELEGTSQHPHTVFCTQLAYSFSFLFSVLVTQDHLLPQLIWPCTNSCSVPADPSPKERGQNHCVSVPWLASRSEWDGHCRPECQYLSYCGHHLLLRKYSCVHQLGSPWTLTLARIKLNFYTHELHSVLPLRSYLVSVQWG